jgi:serine/threonine-protein kinase ATR
VAAVVKLITRTAVNYPGVYYHGKATATLPVIARLLPFFADPLFRSIFFLTYLFSFFFTLFCFSFLSFFSFRSCHGVFFQAIGSLLSLLRSGARDSYRQFFVDSMFLIEGSTKLTSIIMNALNSFKSNSITNFIYAFFMFKLVLLKFLCQIVWGNLRKQLIIDP